MPIPAKVEKISDCVWEIPASCKENMRVPARIYASQTLLEKMDDGVFEQVTNVATLPGIVRHAFCMPDGHWGYGFPIGGVAAVDPQEGVISPGGIGFDINCGMRLVRTNLTLEEVRPHLTRLIDRLFQRIPAGVGATGFVKISREEFCEVARRGARWAIDNKYGWLEDLQRTEAGGCVAGADPAQVSPKAIDRGFKQIGTLGSGNHYLEIQVATDYLQTFLRTMGSKYGLSMPDRELACAPFPSQEGQDYFSAMNCAINMSFANRQVILHRIREVFSEVFGKDPAELGMHQVYDVAHNTAQLETHLVGGRMRQLLVHRKGATRALGPGMAGLPDIYKKTGQPVIIGGSMETGSYLLAGVAGGDQTFYSTAHGSGRAMSRSQAKRTYNGKQLQQQLKDRGIYIRCASFAGLAEEAGAAYKNIDEVVTAAEQAGISRRVVRFLPIGNVKG